jgi:hypothetical protein
MARTDYDVVYIARSPADMKQDDFGNMVNEVCNGRAAEGWRLVSTAGDYGARITLGVWLYFAREGDSASERPLTESYGDDVPGADVGDDTAKLADEGETFAGG